ncbi:tetratricopeptide repeat protein [Streptomyces smyrnaeus]|uniref:AfsR/SARP family transcriptional regulator n=1 Tax=Streptomyces smyrnaeus TaxID=1387713 RepID=UPI00369E87D8
MDFEILLLGPVGLRVDGLLDPLGSAKERALLAALAVDVGKAVSTEALIRRLWGEDLPAKPQSGLHVYVARLRRRFRQAADRVPLVQRAHTYALDVAPDFIDLHRFHRLTSHARSVRDTSGTEALAALREAETLWRGEPLAGLTGAWAEEVRAALEATRLAARVDQADLELRAGDFTGPATYLPPLLEQQPTNETLAGRLMVAYYGCGRQADALRVYEHVRKLLRNELGVDPGTAFSELHGLILRQAPVSAFLPSSASDPAPPQALNNLPAHADLVGREGELAALQEPPPEGTVIALQSISGMAGIGKSLLAFHAARKLAHAYPDGQLYVDLRAHSARRRPLTPSSALASLLRTLGLPSKGIPHSLEERTTLWRSLLQDRRAVVVLDDVAGAEQIRPLLPLGSPSLVLLTSRQRLSGLPGVRSLFVDVLSAPDAVALFTRLVGPERARDGDEVAHIVDVCGRLPLAIELAAGRLRSRPSWTTRHLLRRLAQSHSRLREIRDRDSGIDRAFELSYRTLTRRQQAAFRRLGLHFGTGFGSHAAAALIGVPVAEAEPLVEALLDSSLLTEPEPERYRFHDLLGEYALTLARRDREEETAALERLVDFCLAAALRADLLVHPRRTRIDIAPGLPSDHTPVFRDDHEARSWLLDETPALLAAEDYARTHGSARKAAELAHVLGTFLDTEGLWDDAELMHRHAAQYWHQQRADRAEALALIDLSSAHGHTGRYDQAAAAGSRALAVARAADDAECAAEALHQLGILHWHRGEYRAMLEVQREALEIRLRSGEHWHVARSTNNMGIAHLHLGDSTAAFRYFQEALLAFREIRDARGEAQALNNLAEVHLHTGDISSARQFFSRSLMIATESCSRSEQAMAQLNLGNTLAVPEELDEALDLYGKALSSFQRLGNRRYETITRIALGDALRKAGRYADSLEQHRISLTLARGIGAGLEEAQALRGLGTAEHHLQDHAAAHRDLEEALGLATRIQSPEEEARAKDALAELHLACDRPDQAIMLWESSIGIFEQLDPTEAIRIKQRLRRAQDLRE